MIRVSPTLSIDEASIVWRFIRSPGPGGQNVNKVASACELRFDSRVLPRDIRTRFATLAGRRLANDGTLVIQARRFRTQERNRADALERLIALLAAAAVPPETRIDTRVPRAQRRRRLESKRHRSTIKKGRGSGGEE
ncbi:MAG: aminoacyl-tRNA hydrolase [Alphaproteobacteria bacterium]|nr:aminoacyl-tRNA hydrolase [Alphaproteobacteria bacterium]